MTAPLETPGEHATWLREQGRYLDAHHDEPWAHSKAGEWADASVRAYRERCAPSECTCLNTGAYHEEPPPCPVPGHTRAPRVKIGATIPEAMRDRRAAGEPIESLALDFCWPESDVRAVLVAAIVAPDSVGVWLARDPTGIDRALWPMTIVAVDGGELRVDLGGGAKEVVSNYAWAGKMGERCAPEPSDAPTPDPECPMCEGADPVVVRGVVQWCEGCCEPTPSSPPLVKLWCEDTATGLRDELANSCGWIGEDEDEYPSWDELITALHAGFCKGRPRPPMTWEPTPSSAPEQSDAFDDLKGRVQSVTRAPETARTDAGRILAALGDIWSEHGESPDGWVNIPSDPTPSSSRVAADARMPDPRRDPPSQAPAPGRWVILNGVKHWVLDTPSGPTAEPDDRYFEKAVERARTEEVNLQRAFGESVAASLAQEPSVEVEVTDGGPVITSARGGAPTGPGWPMKPRTKDDLGRWGEYWWANGAPMHVGARLVGSATGQLFYKYGAVRTSEATWGGPCIQGSADAAIRSSVREHLHVEPGRNLAGLIDEALAQFVDSRAKLDALIQAAELHHDELRDHVAGGCPMNVPTMEAERVELRGAIDAAKGTD